VADALLLLFLIVPLSLVDGIQILTARRVGQRRPDQAGAAFNQGLLFVLGLSIVATGALKLFTPVVAAQLVQSPPVGAAVNAYLQIDAYSIPLAGISFACSAWLVSLGKTRALVPTTLILVVGDVVLNYLFIFGELGCPALGMRGAAIGSVGSELAAALFLTAYVWRAFDRERYALFCFTKPEPHTTRVMARLAGPIAAQRFLQDFRWFVFFLIVERVGVSALAIANVVYTCYIVFWIPTQGFAETVCSMVSRFVGRNRSARIGEVLRTTTFGAVLATVPLILLALAAPQWVVAAFSHESVLAGDSGASLRVVALAMVVAIPAHLWFTAVEGTGDTTAALGIDLLLTLVMLGLTYLAAIHLGWPMAMVWLAVPITWLVCLGACYGWMRCGFWKRLEV
jgi:Na+-driven multidrug efflux pump